MPQSPAPWPRPPSVLSFQTSACDAQEEMERRVQVRMEDIRRESVEASDQRPERPATVPPGDRA